MDSATKTALIGLAGATLGYAFSFFTASFTNRAALKRAEAESSRLDRWKVEDIRRERLEELYSLVDQFVKVMGGQFVLSLIYMNRKMSSEEYNTASAKQRDENPFQFERIQMLVAMYFGSLEGEWKELVRVRNAANELRPIFGSALASEHTTRDRQQEFGTQMNLFNELGERFKARLTGLCAGMLVNK